MGLAHVPVDIGTGLPGLDGDDMTGGGDAFMHVAGEAALLAAGGGDAILRSRYEACYGFGANLRPRNDDDRIGHKEAVPGSWMWAFCDYSRGMRADARALEAR